MTTDEIIMDSREIMGGPFENCFSSEPDVLNCSQPCSGSLVVMPNMYSVCQYLSMDVFSVQVKWKIKAL